MQPTILYNPKNGITMSYSSALAAMAPNLVALTDAEYAKIAGGETVRDAKADAAVHAGPSAPSRVDPPEPSGEKPRCIDDVPDDELLDFTRSIGLDFTDVLENASEDEKPQAIAYIRKKAAAAMRKIAAGKAKG